MTSRREFVRTASGALVALVGAPSLLLASRRAADIIIRGGTVFDGTGSDGVESDVAILAGRITEIAPRIAGVGGIEIDARGLAVSPGFVDIHSHGDGTLWDDPRAESLIREGITTIVVGQDGSSRAPRRTVDEDGGPAAEDFTAFWKSLSELHPAVNVASMVGLGTIRGLVVGGDDRPATPDEMKRMVQLVSQALEQGACGASSGLEYTPGGFASREELIALCVPLAARRLPYATHMRNEDDQLIEAIDEAIEVARGAECPLQISHLKTQGQNNWSKLGAAFGRVASARAAGVDVAFDRYPYLAYQTGLSNLFPIWSRDGSTEAFLARLTDPATADRIKTEALAKVESIGGWDHVMVSNVSNPDDKSVEGARLGTWASAAGVDPYDATLGLLQRNGGSVGMVGFAMSETNLEHILSHPHGMVCSDGGSYAVSGPAHVGHPHPRGLGAFPRVLARYVRERKTLTLPEAIYKMSGAPAGRIRMADRGKLAQDMAADVVVFDPATVMDMATYADPFQYPVGIKAVLVNGTPALLDGQRGERLSGVPVVAG